MTDQAEALEIDMEFPTSPARSLKVSPVAIGTWAIGGWMWGGTDEAESIATIRAAFEHGINIIDTAPAYGFGRSEEIVGKAIAEGRLRSQVLIATKAGLEWKDGKVFRNASRARILREVDNSLRRLRTDYIDIYQVHWPDPLVPIEETAEAMQTLFKQGKIRAIGVSNFSVSQMRAVSPRCAAACAAAALQSVRARDRGRPFALLPQEQNRDASAMAHCVAVCCPDECGRYRFRRRRSATHRSEIPRAPVRAISVRRAKARSARAGTFRQARHSAGGPLDARSRYHHGAVGRAASRSTAAGRRGDGLAARCSAKAEIDRILHETITDPVGPEFMAPPARGGAG